MLLNRDVSILFPFPEPFHNFFLFILNHSLLLASRSIMIEIKYVLNGRRSNENRFV